MLILQWKRHEHADGGKWWNGNNEAVYAWEPYSFFYVVGCLFCWEEKESLRYEQCYKFLI